MAQDNDEQTEMDLNETKAERWKRLANYRYVKAVERIRMLSNLGNTNNYEYTDDQVLMLFGNLRSEIDAAEQAFRTQDEEIEELF